MSTFVSVIQAAAWPLTLGLVLLWNRRAFGRFLEAIVGRIEGGAPLRAGGIEIGQVQKLPAVRSLKPEGALEPRSVDVIPHNVYLIHGARRDRTLDRSGYEYYRVRVIVDADSPARLDNVAAVTYHLHPTFKEPVRRVLDRSSSFEMKTAAWGEFNMSAEIEFVNGEKITIERYINLSRVDV